MGEWLQLKFGNKNTSSVLLISSQPQEHISYLGTILWVLRIVLIDQSKPQGSDQNQTVSIVASHE